MPDAAPNSFAFLWDTPLFIDEKQVSAFYDAVLRPAWRLSTVQDSEDTGSEAGIEGKASLEAEAGLGKGIFGFLLGVDAKAKVGVEAGGNYKTNDSSGQSRTYLAIDNPYRQLLYLVAAYSDFEGRLRLLQGRELAATYWQGEEFIDRAPRPLVMIQLPGLAEAEALELPPTSLIPTAMETTGGEVVSLYAQIRSEDERVPPKYPERPKAGGTVAELRAERKMYWAWFRENFSAKRAMILVEEATKDADGLRWIDFRLPLNGEGDTLHLHVCPRGSGAVGDFAYNMIKRGYEHGLRIIGSLKSGPDMNVLAVFER